jgi:hypothetical protein
LIFTVLLGFFLSSKFLLDRYFSKNLAW